MPKVTEQYLADRRAQILEAARSCFLREGFHATSMQDVFAESGLSAGAVYRYFAGKDEMIIAIADENMREVAALIRTRTGASGDSFGEILAHAVEVIGEEHARRGTAALAMQVWAEASRNPALRERFSDRLTEIRAWLLAAVRDAQRTGELPADVAAESLAAVFGSLVPGFMQQLALGGSTAVDGITDALRALWPAPAGATVSSRTPETA